MLAQLPCEQIGHFWVIIDPPNFSEEEHSALCYCPDCGANQWVMLPLKKFEEVLEKFENHQIKKENLTLGRI